MNGIARWTLYFVSGVVILLGTLLVAVIVLLYISERAPASSRTLWYFAATLAVVPFLLAATWLTVRIGVRLFSSLPKR